MSLQSNKIDLQEILNTVNTLPDISTVDGYSAGYNVGLEDGKEAAWNEFWDSYQDNGSRTNYQYGFAGWRDENLYPKYDIVLGNGYHGAYMFYDCRCEDLTQRLEDCGVTFDTSKCGDMYQMFGAFRGKRVPRIDCSSSMSYNRGAQYLFSNVYNLETVDALVLQENTSLTGAFNNCKTLKNITIEGTIGQNLDMKSCTVLSKASIINIINHLSSTTSGLTVTLSETAVISAYGTNYLSNQEWLNLRATKTNWTISLV